MDAGAIVARMESGATSTELKKWESAGVFAQGAISLFSNVLEDSKNYRKLTSDYDRYKQYIRTGKLSRIPYSIRNKMLQGLDPKVFPPETLKRIKQGKDQVLNAAQKTDLEDSLWRNWFYDKKFTLNEKFAGHMRIILAGSAYYFFNEKTFWDVGAFVEYVDRMKTYVILAKRDKYGIYLGAELTKGGIRAAAAGGLNFSPTNVAGASSLGWRFFKGGLPMEVGITGFGRSSNVPDYAAPMHTQEPYTTVPEFGAMIYFMIGGGGVPLFQQGGAQTPSMSRRR
jgi:hypothetical protein